MARLTAGAAAPAGVPEADARASRELTWAALAPMSREQVDLAIPLLREALDLDPRNADARALLGTALVAGGDVRDGVALVERAAIDAPDRFLPRLKAGEMSIRIGDLQAAEEHVLAALRVAAPGSRDAEATRTLLANVRARSRKAIDHHAVIPRGRGRLGIALRSVQAAFSRPVRAGPVEPEDGDEVIVATS